MNEIGLFLIHLFKDNFSYSSLNSARAALSFFLSHKLDIGSDVYISRLFRYFFKARPSQPRYLVSWDVSKLLLFLKSWHPPAELSLRLLTLKTVTLVAVTSSDRAQTLNSIDIEHSSLTEDAILFPIFTLLKGSKRNRPIRVVKCHKFSDPSLNVADYVAAYLNRTLQFRLRAVSLGLPKPRSLFLSYHTGKPVRTSTLSRYILTTMQLAGIDTQVFKAHSARGIFPSLMKRKGASASTIMQQGDWRNCSTFERFYSRESEDSVAGKLIREVIGKSKN